MLKIKITAACLCLMLSACGLAEKQLDSMADESAQTFNSMASKVSSPEEAKNCVAFYKRMEMDFIGFKIKHGFDGPIARFRKNTSKSLLKLQSEFKTHPEYGDFEKTIKKLGED